MSAGTKLDVIDADAVLCIGIQRFSCQLTYKADTMKFSIKMHHKTCKMDDISKLLKIHSPSQNPRMTKKQAEIYFENNPARIIAILNSSEFVLLSTYNPNISSRDEYTYLSGFADEYHYTHEWKDKNVRFVAELESGPHVLSSLVNRPIQIGPDCILDKSPTISKNSEVSRAALCVDEYFIDNSEYHNDAHQSPVTTLNCIRDLIHMFRGYEVNIVDYSIQDKSTLEKLVIYKTFSSNKYYCFVPLYDQFELLKCIRGISFRNYVHYTRTNHGFTNAIELLKLLRSNDNKAINNDLVVLPIIVESLISTAIDHPPTGHKSLTKKIDDFVTKFSSSHLDPELLKRVLCEKYHKRNPIAHCLHYELPHNTSHHLHDYLWDTVKSILCAFCFIDISPNPKLYISETELEKKLTASLDEIPKQ